MARKKRDLVVEPAVDLEVVQGTVLAPAGWERYQGALECLQEGGSFGGAAKVAGVSTQALWSALQRMPEVALELKQRRAVLREVANLTALAVLNDRLQRPEEISNRDLTDILRAIKPPHEDLASNVKLNIDIRV